MVTACQVGFVNGQSGYKYRIGNEIAETDNGFSLVDPDHAAYQREKEREIVKGRDPIATRDRYNRSLPIASSARYLRPLCTPTCLIFHFASTKTRGVISWYRSKIVRFVSLPDLESIARVRFFNLAQQSGISPCSCTLIRSRNLFEVTDAERRYLRMRFRRLCATGCRVKMSIFFVLHWKKRERKNRMPLQHVMDSLENNLQFDEHCSVLCVLFEIPSPRGSSRSSSTLNKCPALVPYARSFDGSHNQWKCSKRVIDHRLQTREKEYIFRHYLPSRLRFIIDCIITVYLRDLYRKLHRSFI